MENEIVRSGPAPNGAILFVGGMTVDEQLKELTQTLINVRLDLKELSTKVDSIKDVAHSVTDIDKRLVKAEDSTKAAHKRMDKIEKVHAWIAMTIGGGLLAAIVTFIIKGGLVK